MDLRSVGELGLEKLTPQGEAWLEAGLESPGRAISRQTRGGRPGTWRRGTCLGRDSQVIPGLLVSLCWALPPSPGPPQPTGLATSLVPSAAFGLTWPVLIWTPLGCWGLVFPLWPPRGLLCVRAARTTGISQGFVGSHSAFLPLSSGHLRPLSAPACIPAASLPSHQGLGPAPSCIFPGVCCINSQTQQFAADCLLSPSLWRSRACPFRASAGFGAEEAWLEGDTSPLRSNKDTRYFRTQRRRGHSLALHTRPS